MSVLSVQERVRAVYVWQGEKVSNPLPLVLETNPDPVEFKAPALYLVPEVGVEPTTSGFSDRRSDRE